MILSLWCDPLSPAKQVVLWCDPWRSFRVLGLGLYLAVCASQLSAGNGLPLLPSTAIAAAALLNLALNAVSKWPQRMASKDGVLNIIMFFAICIRICSIVLKALGRFRKYWRATSHEGGSQNTEGPFLTFDHVCLRPWQGRDCSSKACMGFKWIESKWMGFAKVKGLQRKFPVEVILLDRIVMCDIQLQTPLAVLQGLAVLHACFRWGSLRHQKHARYSSHIQQATLACRCE